MHARYPVKSQRPGSIQKAWRVMGKYLPPLARARVEAMYKRYKERRAPDEGVLDDYQLAHETRIGEAVDGRAPTGTDDGMRDYPTTRPHLAFGYLEGLVRWLAESNYTVLSYRDLETPVAVGHEAGEFRSWIDRACALGQKAVLLQYDVDARPDVTVQLMRSHIKFGVPGNAMVFRRKIFDWKLKRQGILEYDDSYELDFKTFEAFQKAGGTIGYHCNAFDRSGDSMERAIEIFHEDVAELRRHIDVRFFSMHGGHVTPEGRCNARMEIEPYLEELGLTWVHNGRSLYFHANWADGSASNPRYRNEANDPLDFILSTGVGERTRLLFHPQYYNDFSNTRFDFPILQDQTWIRKTRDIVERRQFDGSAYWRHRHDKAICEISNVASLFEADEVERPVFIHGMSRSGTTLLVSMFDAHPEGAMAYESYPRYLHVPSDDGVLTTEEYIHAYQVLINYQDNEAFRLLNRPPLRNLMRFAAVSSWTGMTNAQIGSLLRTYLVRHHRVGDVQEALKIVAASARFKVRAQKATYWGTKCQGNFDDYFALWPAARLIYIERNGLDILASQKTNGAFNPDPEALGKNWRTGYERFVKYAESHPDRSIAHARYEDLVMEPERTSRQLCDSIGLAYDPRMVRQHEVETTLSKNPRGQLSAERVQQPIDQASIGKWCDILTREDIEAFLEGCGGAAYYRDRGYNLEF